MHSILEEETVTVLVFILGTEPHTFNGKIYDFLYVECHCVIFSDTKKGSHVILGAIDLALLGRFDLLHHLENIVVGLIVFHRCPEEDAREPFTIFHCDCGITSL